MVINFMARKINLDEQDFHFNKIKTKIKITKRAKRARPPTVHPD